MVHHAVARSTFGSLAFVVDGNGYLDFARVLKHQSHGHLVALRQ